jgi:tRNA synthetases class I (I, L, M and V)
MWNREISLETLTSSKPSSQGGDAQPLLSPGKVGVRVVFPPRLILMSSPLAYSMAVVLDHYDPLAIESTWYDWWDSQGFFKPQLAADGKPAPNGVFVLPLAIPTINGPLHLGHALTFTIQDTLCRWYGSCIDFHDH